MAEQSGNIHPTAIIAESASIGSGVTIAPYAVVEDDVEIGDNTVIGSHSVIHRYTRIGRSNTIHAHCVLGDKPQHLKFEAGTVSWLQVGDNNDIREMVTMHRALYADASTVIGSNCLFMNGSHIGHDCIIEDDVVITSGASIGGHVEIGNGAMIGGLTGVHQFVRIGGYSMIAAGILVRKDVLPYAMLGGFDARHIRLNTIGLKRRGITGVRYRGLETIFRMLRNGEAPEFDDSDEQQYLMQWLQAPSNRGVAGFRRKMSVV